MAELDYLIIGHVTVDQLAREAVMGGTATYAALTARNLGRRVGLLTSADFQAGLVDLLDGVRVARLPAEETTRFVNSYLDGAREQRIEAIANPLSFRHLLTEWRDAPLVHLAPVAGEIDPDVLKGFPRAFLGVTPQGWMRAWDGQGLISAAPWSNAEPVLDRADAVVFSADDVADSAEIVRWAGRARVMVVTHGRAGAIVYHKRQAHHSPAFQAGREVDPTGAGDVFAAAFFVRLAQTRDPIESADFANCVASFVVEKRGPEAVPTLEQVEERWRKGKRRRDKPPTPSPLPAGGKEGG